MILIGDPLLACDATGRLKNRIATVFLKTKGIVTTGPMHIMQRQIWVDHLNTERQKQGMKPLTPQEAQDEMELSVDLLMDNDEKVVQIRPDPKEMDMAFIADEMLQETVSKRKIVYLNIDNPHVRNRLMMKGEYWRMSQLSSDSEQMIRQISTSRVSINNQPLYYYNKNTGSRFLTVGAFKGIASLPDSEFKEQFLEIITFSQNFNYHGHTEIAVFPPDCEFTRDAFKAIDQELPIQKLRTLHSQLVQDFTKSVPDELINESVSNLAWRNKIYEAITSSRKSKSTCEVLRNISNEFYKQIQWLPGANITEDGELIFDKVFDEARSNPYDQDLANICDVRVKEFIQNYLRQFRNIEYINIGRITRSLNIKRAASAQKRSNVYIVHFKSADKNRTSLRIIRFQKYCIYEHLESGKDMLTSIMEAVDYTDYIFNRRLACIQLGMRLPKKFVTGRIRETYHGKIKEYDGWRIWVVYFERDYVNGIASDKIPQKRYENPDFTEILAKFMGEAAAVNIVVGRSDKEGNPLFDDGDEVIQIDDDTGLPCDLTVSDHTGTLNNFKTPLYVKAEAYAGFINNHAKKIVDPEPFIDVFLNAFRSKLEWIQAEYEKRQPAFDGLFAHLPYDEGGSLAYRWEWILRRLKSTDAENLTELIRANLTAIRR